ncbi:MAG: UbiX family flavin prenyltransferase [Phycisphaerales bacterium]|nr:UbiX family flavin prenyltransferase [Phycisphaerales bacterium]
MPTVEPDPHTPRRIILGISGASGALYAQRALTALLASGVEVHLVITDYGKRLLHDELGFEGPLATWMPRLAAIPEPPADADPTAHARAHNIVLHPIRDVGANIASGSFRHDGMLIMPCSSNTLGQIASGLGDTLLTRAAAVCLKERFPLVLCHRESPLSLVDIENMRTLTLAGASICPANPGWYLNPQSLDDIVDFVVARALDQLRIPHNVGKRWGHAAPSQP